MSAPTEQDREHAKAPTHEIVHLLDRTTPLSIGGSLVLDIQFIIAAALQAERERTRAEERDRLAPMVYEMVMAGRSAKEISIAIRALETAQLPQGEK